MKGKKYLKVLAVMLSMVLLLLSCAFTSAAENVPNASVNVPGTYTLANTGIIVNGYATSALSNDFQLIAMTIAGKKAGSANKVVCIGCQGSPMNNRYLSAATHTPSGIAIGSLSYSGSGATSGNETSAYRDAFTLYYILVDSYVAASSTSKTYYSYPSITVQT